MSNRSAAINAATKLCTSIKGTVNVWCRIVESKVVYVVKAISEGEVQGGYVVARCTWSGTKVEHEIVKQ